MSDKVNPTLGLPPMEDRQATITIVWHKNGDVLVDYPVDLWLAIRMLSRSIDAVAEKAREDEALKAKEPSRIIMPPQIDRKYLKR